MPARGSAAYNAVFRSKHNHTQDPMGFNLALSAAALAMATQASPAGNVAPPALLHGDSFTHLAQPLDVVSIAPPPPEPGAASDVPEPASVWLLAAGMAVMALFAARSRR